MPYEEEDPVETPNSVSGLYESQISHPAFGSISARRVQGSAQLFDSELHHQHYVTVSIGRAKIYRDGTQDRAMGEMRDMIEVAMSEAQWATFISSMNVGIGVPCTLRRLDNVGVPQIPRPKEPTRRRFERALDATMTKIRDNLVKMSDGIDGAITKTKATALKQGLINAADQLTDNAGFVAEMFIEHMENVTEKAKIEINAYVTATVHTAGLSAIIRASPLSLPGKEEP